MIDADLLKLSLIFRKHLIYFVNARVKLKSFVPKSY
jgi:hypothetical protein